MFKYLILFNLVVTDPPARTNGFVFVRIQGGFHEIRNSVRTKKIQIILILDSVTLLMGFNYGDILDS